MKATESASAFLNLSGRSFQVPESTLVIPNCVAIQSDPRYWGKDTLHWRPLRWIQTNVDDANAGVGKEALKVPEKGTFLAWSEGIRNCPGRKFSQVEVVATLVSLLREWEVAPALGVSEGNEDGRLRMQRALAEGTGQVLLLQMLHPERSPLKWTPR